MENIAIKVENLNKVFKIGNEDFQVIKNLNFEIEDGDFVSIMGPSGCGKSTLLYMLGALDKPTSGDIYIYGKNYKEMSAKDLTLMKRRDVGFIFQFYNLVPNLSVEDNILLPLLVDKKNIKEYRDRYKDILELTEISSKVDRTPRELSGGQQQRVAIARALMIEPKILFADEPIGNLDVKTGQNIMELFVNINKELKTTIVQVTHSPESAEYGKTLIRLLDGEILEKKKLETVK